MTSFNTVAQDDAAIQAGKKLFNANCAACHKINKRAVGPALKGVSAKYDKEWLYSWIKNSTAMVKSGDAQAVAIYEEYKGTYTNNDADIYETNLMRRLAGLLYIDSKTMGNIKEKTNKNSTYKSYYLIVR